MTNKGANQFATVPAAIDMAIGRRRRPSTPRLVLQVQEGADCATPAILPAAIVIEPESGWTSSRATCPNRLRLEGSFARNFREEPSQPSRPSQTADVFLVGDGT